MVGGLGFLGRFRSDGVIDRDFGSSLGKQSLPRDFQVESIVVDKNDRILVEGWENEGFSGVIYAFSANGTRDEHFGNAGRTVFRGDSQLRVRLYEMAFQGDQILVAGTSQQPGFGEAMQIARLNADGSWDRSGFGEGGQHQDWFGAIIEPQLGGYSRGEKPIGIFPTDDAILVAGAAVVERENPPSDDRYWLVHASLTSDGKSPTSSMRDPGLFNDAALSDEGEIVAVGVRFDGNGDPGLWLVSHDDVPAEISVGGANTGNVSEGRSVVVDHVGRFVIGGTTDRRDQDFAVVRLMGTGSSTTPPPPPGEVPPPPPGACGDATGASQTTCLTVPEQEAGVLSIALQRHSADFGTIDPGSSVTSISVGDISYENTTPSGASWSATVAASDMIDATTESRVAFTRLGFTPGSEITPSKGVSAGAGSAFKVDPQNPAGSFSAPLTLLTGEGGARDTFDQFGSVAHVVVPTGAQPGSYRGTLQYSILSTP